MQYGSTQYIFLGYSSMQRGYKCLNPITNKIIIARPVIFDENVFPFKQINSTQPSPPSPKPHMEPISIPPLLIPAHFSIPHHHSTITSPSPDHPISASQHNPSMSLPARSQAPSQVPSQPCSPLPQACTSQQNLQPCMTSSPTVDVPATFDHASSSDPHPITIAPSNPPNAIITHPMVTRLQVWDSQSKIILGHKTSSPNGRADRY